MSKNGSRNFTTPEQRRADFCFVEEVPALLLPGWLSDPNGQLHLVASSSVSTSATRIPIPELGHTSLSILNSPGISLSASSPSVRWEINHPDLRSRSTHMSKSSAQRSSTTRGELVSPTLELLLTL